MRRLTTAILPLLFAAVPCHSAEFTVEKTAGGGAVVRVDGKVFAEYVIDQANKPYLWPIHGPGGRLMTRSYPMAKLEGERTDHPHQRGLCLGHDSLGGFDTWSERLTFEGRPKEAEALTRLGSIRHREYRELAGGPRGVIHAVNDFLDPHGKPAMAEERRMTFSVDGASRVIDVDIDLVAAHGPVRIDDKKDAGLSIRVAHSMTVDAKQGGTIVNANGERDVAAWAKRATWCDFNGPVDGGHVGVAVLNHPSSFRHPTPWHARTYGLFTANPFGLHALDPAAADGGVDLPAGGRIALRHRYVFHEGDERQGGIAEAFAAYAREAKPADLSTAAAPGR